MESVSHLWSPPTHVQELLKRVYPIFRGWAKAKPAQGIVEEVPSCFFEVVKQFEEFAESKGIRPAIFAKGGRGYLAYGKTRCTTIFCLKGETCTFAHSDMEHELHPLLIAEYLSDPKAAKFVEFLGKFSYWVNHTFLKLWEPTSRPATPHKRAMPKAPSMPKLPQHPPLPAAKPSKPVEVKEAPVKVPKPASAATKANQPAATMSVEVHVAAKLTKQ
jgi:hypothetical protein